MRIKLVVLIFILGLGILALYQFSLQPPRSGEKSQVSEIPNIGHYPAPVFSLKDVEDNEVNLGSFSGNNLLLVFWTTWCGWCTKEKPILKEFVNDYQDKIKVIGINIQEEKEVVKKHVEELQLNFPTLLDKTGEVSKSYNITTHPSHFLIDKEGKIRAVRPGFASREDLEALVKILPEE
jgi:peroxiredoxin